MPYSADRKAARLYHPDRNPGRVEEYTPKFQAIQEAHEVLSDATQRAKYDSDRARLLQGVRAFRTNAAAGRKSAYSNYADYSTPQRAAQRPGQNAPRADFAGPRPSAGASRFTNFPKPPPTQQQNAPGAEAQARASAWQAMNGKKAAAASAERPWESDAEAPRRPGPRPTGAFGRSQTSKTGPRRPGFDPTQRGPGMDEKQASGSSAYFTNSRFSSKGGPPPTSNTIPRSTSESEKPDPLKGFRMRSGSNVPFREGNERLRTPYTTHSGEQTYFSSDELKRSASVKDAPAAAREAAAHRKTSSQSSSSTRHRSVSPPRRNFFENPPPNLAGFSHMGAHSAREKMKAADPRRFFDIGYSDSSDEDPRSPSSANPFNADSLPPSRHSPASAEQPKMFGAIPKSRPTPMTAQAPPHPQQQQQNGSSSTETATPVANGTSRNTTPKYDNFQFQSSSNAPSWHQVWPFGPHRPSTTVKRSRLPSWAYPSTLPPLGAKRAKSPVKLSTSPTPSSQVFPISSDLLGCHQESEHHQVSQKTDLELYALDKAAPFSSQSCLHSRNSITEEPLEEPLALKHAFEWQLPSTRIVGADQNAPSSFTRLSNENVTATPRWGEGKSKSDESINTKFSPGEWTEHFDGTANYFAGPPKSANSKDARAPVKRTPVRGKAAGVRTTGEPQTTPNSANGLHHKMPIPNLNGMPPPPPPPIPLQSRPNAPVFPNKPGEVKFSADEWQNMMKESSWAYPQTKSTSPTRQTPSQSRKGSASTATRGRAGSRSAASTATRPASHAKPGKVSESANEDTATGSTTGYDGSGSSTTSHEADPMDVDEPREQTSAQESPSKTTRVRDVPQQPHRPEWRDGVSNNSSATTQTATMADTAKVALNLDPLAKVAPFGNDASTPGSGLNSTTELTSNLPFTSAPSAAHPSKPAAPRTFETPLMPKPPSAPGPGRVKRSEWDKYLGRFANYMRAWASVEDQMLRHFDARRCENNDMMRAAGASTGGIDGWLGRSGDTSGQVGWPGYLRGVREDEQVWQHWGVLREGHREAIEGFQVVRDRIVKAGLVEG